MNDFCYPAAIVYQKLNGTVNERWFDEWKIERITEFLNFSTLDWIKFAGVLIGAIYALYTFGKGNRIKSAELLISLEKDYVEMLPNLLKVERSSDYEKLFKPAILKCLPKKMEPLSNDEAGEMDGFEKILRYFHICGSIRRLGVNRRAIKELNHYYLDVMVRDKSHEEYRPEQDAYILKFWPSVHRWGHGGGIRYRVGGLLRSFGEWRQERAERKAAKAAAKKTEAAEAAKKREQKQAGGMRRD